MDNRIVRNAIDDCAAHHQRSKTFSGAFTFHHVQQVRVVIERCHVKTMLDYGCGKGVQYERAHDETGIWLRKAWPVAITLFEPAWPAYSARPEGTFDMVLCSQVLCWVPPDERIEVLRDVFRYADKAVYIAEQLGPVKKQIVKGQAEWKSWDTPEWRELVRRVAREFPGIDVTLAYVIKQINGINVVLECV